MSTWIPWLGFVTAEALLIYVCVATTAPRIEAELRQGSADALRAENVDLGDDLVMDGRDAWLTGAVVSQAVKDRAGRAVAAVPGVRTVRNLLRAGNLPVEPEFEQTETASVFETTPAPTPEPAPTAPPASVTPRQAPPPSTPAPTRAGSRSEIQGAIDALIADRAVEFEAGRERLTARGAALVDEVAELLGRYPNARIEIAGHTDSQGTSRNNLTMSLRRAEAVLERLVAAGVQESRLTAKGYGEDRPIADNSTSAGRLRNRRVEFSVQ